jgi:hypothetical protein
MYYHRVVKLLVVPWAPWMGNRDTPSSELLPPNHWIVLDSALKYIKVY